MHSCEDMFLMCLWKGRQVNCSEIFHIRKTDNGFCCSFNALNLSEMFQTSEDVEITTDNMTECSIENSADEDNIDYFWSSSESFYGCGGILTEDVGSISSPKAKDLLQCEWIIRASPGKQIRLNFQRFGLNNYNDYKCLDYVSIYNGGSSKFPLLGRYCGHILPPMHISTGNQILVRYRSENSFDNEGFMANYQMLAPDDITTTLNNVSISEGENIQP